MGEFHAKLPSKKAWRSNARVKPRQRVVLVACRIPHATESSMRLRAAAAGVSLSEWMRQQLLAAMIPQSLEWHAGDWCFGEFRLAEVTEASVDGPTHIRFAGDPRVRKEMTVWRLTSHNAAISARFLDAWMARKDTAPYPPLLHTTLVSQWSQFMHEQASMDVVEKWLADFPTP